MQERARLALAIALALGVGFVLGAFFVPGGRLTVDEKNEIPRTVAPEAQTQRKHNAQHLPVSGGQSDSQFRTPAVLTKNCKNGGTFKNGKCHCLVGWTGDLCDVDAAAKGGAWSAAHHGAGLDEGIVPTILKVVRERRPGMAVESVLDVGCGLGIFLKDFHRKGVETCEGVEPSPMNINPESPFSDGTCKQHQIDAFDPSTEEIDLGSRYDIVMSVEVAEHIPRDRHTRYFDFLTRHAKDVLVFSGATVNQGGHGHISERPWAEWLKELNDRGWVFDPEGSKQLRQSSKLWWFQNNLSIFFKNKL